MTWSKETITMIVAMPSGAIHLTGGSSTCLRDHIKYVNELSEGNHREVFDLPVGKLIQTALTGSISK
jgi:hypothetical protein